MPDTAEPGNFWGTLTEAERRQFRDAHAQQKEQEMRSHLWPCGCLINDAGAHRAGCPDHPEGVRRS